MASKEVKAELSIIFNKIMLGLDFREKHANPKDWARYRQYYRGNFGTGTVLPINKIYSMGRALLPQLYFRNPQASVTSTQPGYEGFARVVEAIDNYLLRELAVKNQIKKMCFDAFLYGKGVGKYGYDVLYGMPNALEVDREIQATESEERIIYDVNVKSRMPWFRRVHPVNFVVPWGTESLDDVPWVSCRVPMRLEDVKANKRFENTKDLKATSTANTGNTAKLELKSRMDFASTDNPDEDFVDLWEYYDYKTGKMWIVVEGHDAPLLVTDLLDLEGVPFDDLGFNDDGEVYWSPSDCVQLEPQQKVLNTVSTLELHHWRLARMRVFYDKSRLTEAEFAKVLQEDPVVGVGIEGSPSDSVMAMSVHTPPELALAKREINEDIRETLGFSRNQLGEFDASTRRTAAEAEIVQQASSLRIDERRDKVADLLVNIVRRFNQMVFRFWSEQRVVQVVGPMGAKVWVNFSGEELTGEYLVKIDPESSTPRTRRMRQQEAFALFNAFKGDPLVDQMALRRYLLGQFEDVDSTTWLTNQQAIGQGAIPVGMFNQMMSRGRGMGPVRPVKAEGSPTVA